MASTTSNRLFNPVLLTPGLFNSAMSNPDMKPDMLNPAESIGSRCMRRIELRCIPFQSIRSK